jgi:hypothetical protein
MDSLNWLWSTLTVNKSFARERKKRNEEREKKKNRLEHTPAKQQCGL